MRTCLFSALGSLLLLAAFNIEAQNQFDLSDLQPGQLVLNLSASEQQTVDQDTLVATLQYSAQGKDKTELQDEVNRAITDALAILENSEDVKFSTQQYHVYIYQAGRPARSDIENPVWRAQQSIQLVSTNSSELLDLAGELQSADLHITSLNYTLSSEKYEEIADSLMSAALIKLQSRANQAADALNKSSAELIEVNIDGNQNFGYRPEMVMRAMAAADSVQPPVASPGETQVSITVSARAMLSP